MAIGENIMKCRVEAGLSRKDLAEKVGVTDSMIWQIERGTKAPSMALGKCIAEALGVKIERLYY